MLNPGWNLLSQTMKIANGLFLLLCSYLPSLCISERVGLAGTCDLLLKIGLAIARVVATKGDVTDAKGNNYINSIMGT